MGNHERKTHHPPPPDSTGLAALNRTTEALPRCPRCAAISYLDSWERVAAKVRAPTVRRFPKLTPANRSRFIAAVVQALSAGQVDAAAARAMLYAAQLVPDAPTPTPPKRMGYTTPAPAKRS